MKNVDLEMNRRSFLRGSTLFAGAVGLGLLSPLAALAQPQTPPTKEKPEPDEDWDPFATEEEERDGEKEVLRDANGREYRVCPQCGYNMYRQGRTWTCDNCGYSYVE